MLKYSFSNFSTFSTLLTWLIAWLMKSESWVLAVPWISYLCLESYWTPLSPPMDIMRVIIEPSEGWMKGWACVLWPFLMILPFSSLPHAFFCSHSFSPAIDKVKQNRLSSLLGMAILWNCSPLKRQMNWIFHPDSIK